MLEEKNQEKNKIKSFQKYEGNVDEIKYEKKEIKDDSLVVSRKL